MLRSRSRLPAAGSRADLRRRARVLAGAGTSRRARPAHRRPRRRGDRGLGGADRQRTAACGTTGSERDALVGRGISFCGACDGPLYKGRPVAVVGIGRNAAYEALEIGTYAERVLFVTRTDLLGGASRRALDDVPHITTVDGTLTAIHAAGDGPVSGIDVLTKAGPDEYPIAGVLSAIDVPNTNWCSALVERDETGHVVVDAALRTSVPRVLAAGDVRVGSAHSAFASVADGLTAATTILGSALRRL
ncbi:hypothetical protein BJF90_36045 [Pseudonocardia sp. CNS-004]|nr:hypothetical protein BJF90_36045 [Pseudonocardia sp. CNS-004]